MNKTTYKQGDGDYRSYVRIMFNPSNRSERRITRLDAGRTPPQDVNQWITMTRTVDQRYWRAVRYVQQNAI